MARRKKMIILPRLCDANGDIEKKWWIEYSMRDPRTDEMKRFRNYTAFTDIHSARERYAVAEKLIEELTDKIKNGWLPFEPEKVIYEDELTYAAVAENYGRQKSCNRTIRTYLSDFLALKKVEVNEKSYQTYLSKIRSFCAYLENKQLDSIDVSAINNQIITDYLIFLASKKQLARITISKYQQIVHSFFEYLISKKVIRENPVQNIPRIGVVKDCAPYPIPENERKILAEAIKKKDRQLWLACCMMYYSAIRPGTEIRLIKIGDINLSSRKIIVKSTNAKGNRTDTVDMPTQLHDEFLYHRIDLYDPELYLFGKYGRPGEECIGKNTLRNRFNRIRDDLKLSKQYKFYSWKHSGAESLADNGASTWEIQAHLRHRNIDTTERYARKRLGNRNSRIKDDFPDI